MAALKGRSCLIDGEAVCCEVDGVPSFELLRDRRHDGSVFLYAFDLLELDGRDMRPAPPEERRAALAKLLRHLKSGVHLSDHVEAEGPDCLSARLRARRRGHCEQTEGVPISIRPDGGLGQGEKSAFASRQARR